MSNVVWGIDPVLLEKHPALSGLARKVFVSKGQAFRAFWDVVRSSPSLAAILTKKLSREACVGVGHEPRSRTRPLSTPPTLARSQGLSSAFTANPRRPAFCLVPSEGFVALVVVCVVE